MIAELPRRIPDMSIDAQIINVNEYRLEATADEFVEAITALAARTEAEGERGVLRYQFYVDPDEGTAGATIVYSDAAAWLEHHRLAYTWPEMGALQATVELQRLTFMGPLNDEIEAMASTVPVPVVRYASLAAGFSRST
jgi:quinol monooxygenase YgiN